MTPVIEMLADLVRINSVNNAYEGGPGEGEIAQFLCGILRKNGVEFEVFDVFPGRPNVVAKLPGRDPSRRVILEAHMDTVSVQGMTIPPWEPTIRHGKLYGRGACDTKGGLAAMLQAFLEVARSPEKPPCDIWLAAVVDEEFSFRGVTHLCKGLAGQAALVAEPTDLRAVVASKGVLRWKITTHGVAAHSSKPQLGINAIERMMRLVHAIEQDHQRLAQHHHSMLGPATCNIGTIHGGVQVNFVPDQCTIEIDRRLLPGESASEVLQYYQSMIDSVAAREIESVRGGQNGGAMPLPWATMMPPMLVDEALETASSEQVVTVAQEVLRDLGLNDQPCGVPFGSDASKLSRQGIPSIIIGPGSIDQAHAAIEYVEIEQVEMAVDFYRRFIMQFA